VSRAGRTSPGRRPATAWRRKESESGRACWNLYGHPAPVG
jgi:hypothetical protein